MLVISHFDFDHILGMEKLVETCSVSEIVMPYLTDNEKLMYLISQKDNIPGNDLDYINFLINPLDYFASNKIEKVSLVTNKKKVLKWLARKRYGFQIRIQNIKVLQ